MKYVSLVLLGLLMAVLAGCSSGGDGGKSDLISTLEEDLAMVQADLEAAQGELATTEANLKEKEGELATTQGELTTTQETLTTTQGELTTTQETLTTTQGELTTTQGELTTTQGELTTTQGELTTTQETLTTTQETLTTTQGELTTTQGELTTTQETLTTTKTNLETAQGDLTDKEQAVNTLLLKAGVETLAALSTKLDADGQAYTTLQAQVAGLLTKAGVETLAALSIKLDADGQAYTTLQAQVAGLLLKAGVDDLTALSTKLDADGQAYTTLQGELQTVLAATGAADLTALQTAYNTAKTNYDTLNTQVQAVLTATSSANLTALQTAYNAAKTNYDTLNTQVRAALTATNTASLTALQTTVTSLRTQVSSLQTQLGQAQRQVQDAQTETNTLTQQVDAIPRARGLLTALEAVYDEDDWTVPGNPATARINAKQTAIELTASPLEGSTRKSGDFYNATLKRTAPGVTQPERKTVAYTDLEKSRTFANHYASSIDAEVGGTTSNPRFVNSIWASDNLDLLSVDAAMWISKPSHGGHRATIADDDDSPEAKLVSTLSASVHGVSGRYGCYNSDSGKACKISVAATYANEVGTTATRLELATLIITPEEGGALYFDPGSGTISLLNVKKEGAPVTMDEQYITFGWWQERPALSDGVYQAAVFADITPNTDHSGAAGSAEYEGPAVGLYVDRTSDSSTVIYESGDFTATAILRATFDGGTVVEGDVTNFRTTHGTKNWHVELLSAADDDGNTAKIVQADTNSTGAWEHSFLERHDNVATADAQPIAVTGRFDVGIPNVRHIVGAFGAHRTTDPLVGE